MSDEKFLPNPIGTIERNMCGSKQRYINKDMANRARKRLRSKGETAKINVYQCKFCHYWHIGKKRVADDK